MSAAEPAPRLAPLMRLEVEVGQGLRHEPPEVIAALVRGETVDPARYYFRTVMRFEATAPYLVHLNRLLAVGFGVREARCVKLDVRRVV